MSESPVLYVVGVDPGASTGVAILRVTGGEAELLHVVQGAGPHGLDLAEVMLDRAGRERTQAVVACERYVPQRRVLTHQPEAQRLGGVLERLAAHYGARFTYQGPADARALAPDELLRGLDWWRTGRELGCPDNHDATMATRHALLALSRYRAGVFDRLVARVDNSDVVR